MILWTHPHATGLWHVSLWEDLHGWHWSEPVGGLFWHTAWPKSLLESSHQSFWFLDLLATPLLSVLHSQKWDLCVQPCKVTKSSAQNPFLGDLKTFPFGLLPSQGMLTESTHFWVNYSMSSDRCTDIVKVQENNLSDLVNKGIYRSWQNQAHPGALSYSFTILWTNSELS